MSAIPNPTLEQLRRQLIGSQAHHPDRTIISTGFRSLDNLLPQNGLPSGSLIEWVGDAVGIRTTTIALRCAAGFLKRPGALAVVDPLHEFCAASIAHFNIPLSRLVVVRPEDEHTDGCGRLSTKQRADSLWALEQLARCSGVQILLTWIDRISSTAQRRLQLAVEKSGVTIFMIRPARTLQQTSWADLRFHVQSVSSPEANASASGASRSTVRLIRSKNAVQHHGVALLEWHNETGDVFENSELAGSATATSASG